MQISKYTLQEHYTWLPSDLACMILRIETATEMHYRLEHWTEADANDTATNDADKRSARTESVRGVDFWDTHFIPKH